MLERLKFLFPMRPFTGLLVALFALSGYPPAVSTQESANAELDTCMRNAALGSALTGAILGGILGALVGNNSNRRNQGAAAGAVAGGIAGGIIGWRRSWASCSSKFATASSLATENFQETAKRIGYDNGPPQARIEAANMKPYPEVQSGNPVSVDLRYYVLTPDGRDSQVKITRVLACADEKGAWDPVVNTPESHVVQAGTNVSRGTILIPKLPANMGPQKCAVSIKLESEGQQDQKSATFSILPG